MKSIKSIIPLIPCILVIIYIYLRYQRQSEKIKELENTVHLHEMYGSFEQLKSEYAREIVENQRLFNTINDSISIVYKLVGITVENGSSNLKFNATAINKTDKTIRFVNGLLTVKHNDKTVISFTVNATPDFHPTLDSTVWSESWNLERYIPELVDVLKKFDTSDLETEWLTNSIVFSDSSAIVLNRSSN